MFYLTRPGLGHVLCSVSADHLHQHDAIQGVQRERAVPTAHVRRTGRDTKALPGCRLLVHTGYAVWETSLSAYGCKEK